MLSFSKIASNYVHQKDIQVASMAQYCDTDRSTMYKFLSGKRNPQSQQLVERMADFMKLTPVEKKELIEASRVAIIGADKYYRRKNVIRFLNSYPSDSSDSDVFPHFTHGSSESACTDPLFSHSANTNIPLQNKMDIQQVLYQMLLRESLRSDGLIQIIAQPSWTYLFDLLQTLGSPDSRFQIQHIICLDNSSNVDYRNKDYNISYLRSAISLCQSYATYKPRYYYDRVDSHFNNLNLFPYLILTSEYALTCSAESDTAILYHDSETLKLFRTLFEQQYNTASCLLNQISDSGLEYMNISQSQIPADDYAYQISACPCLLSLADHSLYDKYVADVPQRKMLVDGVTAYSLFLEQQQQRGFLKSFFTAKGLNSFVQTGRVPDIPPTLCHSIKNGDLKYLVQKLYNKVANGHVQMLTGSLENLPINIECLFNTRNGAMITTGRNYTLHYLVLEERHLIDSFMDCLSNLEEMDMIADRNETLEHIERVLNSL